eukprot:1576726-Rhodomonas_salina.1
MAHPELDEQRDGLGAAGERHALHLCATLKSMAHSHTLQTKCAANVLDCIETLRGRRREQRLSTGGHRLKRLADGTGEGAATGSLILILGTGALCVALFAAERCASHLAAAALKSVPASVLQTRSTAG